MHITECMSGKVVSVKEDQEVTEAFRVMKENHIRHLVVVGDADQLIGIITDRDFRLVFSADDQGIYHLPEHLKVSDIMQREVITIEPNTSVEKAASFMIQNRIGGLPVVDSGTGKLLGIVTETDLLTVLAQIFGLIRTSCRLDVALGDDQQSVEKVLAILSEMDREVISFSWNNHYEYAGKEVYSFRLEGEEDEEVRSRLTTAGYDILN